MAMVPSHHMAAELPQEQTLLPLLMVLLRNNQRIRQVGGRKADVLRAK